MTDSTAAAGAPKENGGSAAAVLRNRPFLLLWLSQVSTQIGVNMVLYGLTVIVLESSNLTAAVSGLFLTFLVPSVLLSALAGVYVDRIDRRTVLVVSNALRAAILIGIFAAGSDVGMLLLLNTIFSIVTVFFAPAEAAMIPVLVPREPPETVADAAQAARQIYDHLPPELQVREFDKLSAHAAAGDDVAAQLQKLLAPNR